MCFDTGGYDLKPAAGMLRMKKDMGGAALMLGLAQAVMDADLPVRLEVRIGCVENMVSGRAMRPLDVLPTRRGLTVEVGNTDAEGRLVLCDLLAEASDRAPDLLIDAATLTGAARVALGPDLPALFSNDDALAERLRPHRRRVARPDLAAAALGRLRPVAGEPGGRPEQRGEQADGGRDRRGAVPAALRRAGHAVGPSRHLRLERRDPAGASGRGRGARAASVVRHDREIALIGIELIYPKRKDLYS